MREVVVVDVEVQVVYTLEEVLKGRAQIVGASRESLGTREYLAGHFGRCEALHVQGGFVEGGGFHETVEGFDVFGIPSFVAGFEGYEAFLLGVEAVGIFAP